MTLKALEAGKNVFVEKPLAIHEAQLAEIEEFFRDKSSTPVLMTGFNRRFAPGVAALLPSLRARKTPLIANYRMNAGFIPNDHWVHGPQGGGRNIGEACHIYDLFNALTGSTYESVEAMSIEFGDVAAARIKAGEWPWSFFCWPEERPRPVFPSAFRLLAPADRGERVGVAVRCPVCGKVSLNLVSRGHVDVPFVSDREVGVVEHVFEHDAQATVEEFRSELWSSAFDARRLGLE